MRRGHSIEPRSAGHRRLRGRRPLSGRRAGHPRISLGRPLIIGLFFAALAFVSVSPLLRWSRGASPPASSDPSGYPWFHFRERHRLALLDERAEGSGEGPLAADATPLAAAAEDFDEDGVKDLAIVFSEGAGGRIAVAQGNLDALYPDHPRTRERKANGTYVDAPFLPAKIGGRIGIQSDHLLAGDFNG